MTETVLIKVYGDNVKYIETLPLHHSQQKEEEAQAGFSGSGLAYKPSRRRAGDRSGPR